MDEGPRGVIQRVNTAKSGHCARRLLSRTAPFTTTPCDAFQARRAAKQLADDGRVVAPAGLDHEHVSSFGSRNGVVHGSIIGALAQGRNGAADETAPPRKGPQRAECRIDDGQPRQNVGRDARRHFAPPHD
jgi:hypothetical protein